MKNRVNPVANLLKQETISRDWESATRNNFNDDYLAGKQFNKEWLEIKIEEGYVIYDIGSGTQPIGVNYGMELRNLQGYPNIYPTYVIFYKHLSIIYYYGPTTY